MADARADCEIHSSLSAQWGWSPTAEDPGQGTGLLEEDPLYEMPWIGLDSTVDDHPVPGLGSGDDVNFDLYEQNCPYRQTEPSNGFRPASKMFRLVEEFSDGLVYKGDSFGDHSYIDTDEDRECSSGCHCRLHHQKPEAITFIAYKTPTQLTIDFHSIGLYSEVIQTIGPGDTPLEATSQGVVVNGLSLLKHYQTLNAGLNVLRSTNSTADLLISEMTLLIHGFLLDGEIFKSYGYEDLYENGLLTFDHWKDFQQVQLERDITALEEAYYAIDEPDCPREESSTPLAQADSPEPQSEEIHPDVRMGNEDIAPSLSVPSWSALVAQYSLHDPPSPETGSRYAMQSSGAAAGDGHGGRSPLDRGAAADDLGLYGLTHSTPKFLPTPLGSTPLNEAARAGYESVVRSLLDRGAAVDGVGSRRGPTPLIEAVKVGHKSVVRLLLDRGATVDGSGSEYALPPLAEAAKAGHESVVRLLLDRGATVNGSRSGSGYALSPLTEAAKAGHESVVQLLLDRGATVNGSRSGSGYALSPLTEAAKAGHESVVQLLLDRGAAVDYFGRFYGSTPSAEAAKASHESMIRWLCSLGAAINHPSFCGSTPLVEAARAGHESIVRYLPYRGAAVHPVLGKYFPTPLVEAVRTGRESVVRLLLYDAAPGIQRLSLYKNFSKQYVKLKQKTKTSITSFYNLGSRFPVRHEAWAHGIRTLRGLCSGEPPRNLDDAIAFLCVSRAVSGTLDSNGDFGYTNQFLQDLDRWQILFTSDTTALTAYREAVRMMWDVVLDENLPCSEQASKLETLTYFQALASTMVHQTNGFLGLRGASDRGLESSQERWRLRKAKSIQTEERTPLPSGSRTKSSNTIDPKPPDPPAQPKGYLLRREINEDNSSAKTSPIVVVLMAGAIFAIVVLFLTSPSTNPISIALLPHVLTLLVLKGQRNASAGISCYSAMALRSRESQLLDITHATTNIIHRLQRLAPAHTNAITKLGTKLSCVLKSSMIMRFSELKQAFADHTSPNALGCTELEAQTIKQKAQEACGYYDQVYTLQERYRTLEEYLNLQSHPSIVPARPQVPTSNPPTTRQFYFHPIQTEPTTKFKTSRPATSPQTPQPKPT
ncbi:MAG: hypothetical protein M1840_003072, partial [Geoglossum simile]